MFSRFSGRTVNWKLRIAILIGLATCAVSAYFLFHFASTYQETMQIVVPKQDIPAYKQLNNNNVGIKSVPVGSVGSKVALEPSQVMGKVTTVTLYAGEQIRLERLTEKRNIDVNKQQVAVNVNLTRSVGGVVSPGDIVDVYWVTGDQVPGKLIAQNGIVLKITDGQGNEIDGKVKQNIIENAGKTAQLPAVAVLEVNPQEVPQVVRGSNDKSSEIVLVKKLKAGEVKINVPIQSNVQPNQGQATAPTPTGTENSTN